MVSALCMVSLSAELLAARARKVCSLRWRCRRLRARDRITKTGMAAMVMIARTGLIHQSAARNRPTKSRSTRVMGMGPQTNWRTVSSWRRRSLIMPLGVVS